MLSHFLLLPCCIISIEIFIFFDVLSIFDSMIMTTKKTGRVLMSNHVSDHWKEKVIPHYSTLIFKYSLKALLILLMILALFFLPTIISDDFVYHITSIIGIAESILICLLYVKIRKLAFE